MKNRTTLAALLLVASLTLAGCSATGPSVAMGQEVDAAATGSDGANMEQAIATAAVNRWLSNEGAHSFAGFTYPYNLVTRWEGPQRGTVVLYVDNQIDAAGNPAEDLHMIAAEMLDSIHDTLPDIGKITATTNNGAHSATAYASKPGVIAI